jgi:Carboxypeptidase regulatory-like domain
MTVSIRRAATLLALLLACGGTSFAQGSLGRISGRLIDPNGALIVNVDATIHVKNTATGEMKSVPLSKATGEFTVTGLEAGVYDVSIPISSAMYSAYQQKSVTLKAGQVMKGDISIAWGINLGTIGDDPTMLGADMRKRAGDVSGPTPRTADGKPDLSGMWYVIPLDRGAIPPVPMQKWADDMQKELNKINQQYAAVYCLPQSAIPTSLPFPHKFVQTKDVLVHITEFTTPGYRQIFLDGRPHPPATEWNPAWMGHSVGHWEGDTLVIDTVGFNEITPGFGVHTEKLHVVERIRRPNRGLIEIEMSATDPDAWTGEWKYKYTAGLTPNEEILEFVCPENNLDVLHNGPPWRGRP